MIDSGFNARRSQAFDPSLVAVSGRELLVIDLADRIGLDMPVSRAVHDILHEGADLRETFAALWARPITGENKFLNLALEHPSAG